MNWTAVGAVGEMLGALAVVISILYLSRSLRLGSSTERRRANHELLESTNVIFVALAENPHLASIWGRGLMDFDSLDPAERISFSSLMLNVVYTWEEAYHAAEFGQLDAFAFDRTLGPRQEIVNLPGFQTWWKLRKPWVGPEFREFLDGQMHDPEFSPMYTPEGEGEASGPPPPNSEGTGA